MKLNAPPPGTPVEPPPETPPAEAAAPVAAPAPSVPYEKPPERQLTWPTWFGPADAILAVGLLALAFMAASFTARNSDIFLHLAAGKRLVAGEYKLGTDPFSYTGAERPWVNHSWLFDLGSHLLHSDEGFLLVLLKAIAVAGAFALLLAIRRPGQPMWPWVLAGTFAVLASANLLTLRPIVASFFLLALTMFLVFRLPSPPGSWRLPIAIGVVFALWSNLDAWFVIGPFALLLMLLGQVIRKQLGDADPPDGADPLSSLPDASTLAKTLVVGMLACMANPHHIRIWELPFELIGAEGARLDPRVNIFLTSPLRHYARYWGEESLGLNACGFAYGLLALAGLFAAFLSAAVGRLIGMKIEIEPLPLPLAILWSGFFALSLLSMFAIPFFAVVSVPLLASRCNLYSARVQLGTTGDGRGRALVTASSAGRLATILALAILVLVARPGWLHAPASAWWESGLAHPANTRRVEWRIETDPDMREAAEWLEGARAGGTLPADVRGFPASVDFANYCAYFAPHEKVFANARFSFHAPELADFAKARRGLGAFLLTAEPPDVRESEEVFAKWKAAYVALAWQRSDTEANRMLLSLQAQTMWLSWARWSPWFFNGRSAICGWKPAADPSFDKLRLDPGLLAYGPGVKPLPPNTVAPPNVQISVWDELFTERRPTPTGAEECIAWLKYKETVQILHDLRMQVGGLLRLNQPAMATPVIPQTMFLARDEFYARNVPSWQQPPPADGSFQTYAILALRAARRSIAENPDHPDGYFALVQVLKDRDLPIGEGERSVSLATAMQQCLARMPKPEDYKRRFFLTSPSQIAEQYALHLLGRPLPGSFEGLRVDMGGLGHFTEAGYLYRVPPSAQTRNRTVFVRQPQERVQQLPQGSTQLSPGLRIYPLDTALQALASAEDYARFEHPSGEVRTEELKRLGNIRKDVSKVHDASVNALRAAEKAKFPDRIRIALNEGLVDKALADLNGADLLKEYGAAEFYPMLFKVIALQMSVGRLEEASANLAMVKDLLEADAAKGTNPELIKYHQRALSEILFQKHVLEGNYHEAGLELESQEGAGTGIDSIMAGIDKLAIDPKQYKNFEKVVPPMLAIEVAWPAIPMLGAPVYGPGGAASIVTLYWSGVVELEHFGKLLQSRQLISSKMQRDSEFFYRRGFLSLLEGDIESAKLRFQSTYRKAPPGWNLPDIRHQAAENLLKLIEAANKPKK